jgi:molecular chaperone DnaJ
MSTRDVYEVLGLARDADEKAIKSAYRRLALKYHPDQNAGDAEAEAKFREVADAYSILSDPQKRAAYDRYGHAAFRNGAAGGPGGGGGGGPDPRDIFEDLFGQIFGAANGGAGRRRSGPQRGADLRYDLEITLEDAFSGRDVEIRVPGHDTCGRCKGDGSEPGHTPETCGDCGGAGRVRASNGFFQMERTCGRCGGRGRVIRHPCNTCHGRGQVDSERVLNVAVPAGVEAGMRIRLSGEGEPGPGGGPRGDLFIFVAVRDHELFERDGANLYCRTPVPMTTAALGGEIEIPTIDGGRARVAIPEGTQTGRQFRLRGKGMPVLRQSSQGGGQGDLYMEVFVETPRNLTGRQRELLREFEQGCCEDHHPDSHGFMGKVRRFWDGLGRNGEAH